MDEYIVDSELMPGFLIYFKNGKLHREAGPAIIPFIDKEKYFYEDDKDLYQKGEVKVGPFIKMTILVNVSAINNKNNNVSHYIDGQSCEKEQFYRNKFEKELSNSNSQEKKLKI